MEDTNKTQAELLKEVAELRQEITRLKQAELHIQQNETRNRTLLNALPDLIFRLSEDGTYLDVNVPADYPTIVPLDNVIGKNISELLTPEDTQRRLRYINLALTSGQTQIYEQSVWVAGKEYYEEVRVVPIGAKEVLMIVRDFTSRRQSERTLAKQATELETVARVSTAASTILEVDQLLQEVADLTKESFGLYHAHIYRLNETEDTLVLAAGAGQVGRKMAAQGWSIPLDREQSLVARAARIRQAVIVNDVRQNPDWLPNPLLPKTRSELAVPLIVGEQVLGVLDVQSDTVGYFTQDDARIQTTLAAQIAVALQNARHYEQTRQRAAELEETTNFLNSIIGNIPTGLFVKDARDLSFVEWNSANEALTGLKKEEVLGKTDYDLFPQEEADYFVKTDRDILASGKIVEIPEEPIHTADKRIRWLYTRKTPIYGTDGKPKYLLGISLDITERKRAEETLHENEARLSEALKIAHMANWEFDVATQTFTFNDHFYALLRTTAEQEGGYQMPAQKYAQKFVHPDDAYMVGVEIEQALKTTDPNYSRQLEHRIIRADGSKGYVQVRFRVIKDEQGQTIKTVGANQDITERKEAEEALRASETRNRALLESIPDLIIRYSKEGVYLDIKEPIGFKTFLPPEQLLGKTMAETTPGKLTDLRMRYIRQALQTGQLQLYEQELPSNGHTRYEEIRIIPIGHEEVFAIIRDITARKQEEAEREELLAEVQRLAAIVENHPDFIGVGTLDGKALYVNPAGLRMMGLPADHDVTTMQAADFYPPDDAALLLEEGVPKAMQQGWWAAEANLLRVDGATIPVEQTIGLNYDAAGKPYSFSITMRDIRERKQAEAERERLLLEVQEAYRQFVRREWDKFLSQQHHQNWHFEFQREDAGKSANADRLVELQHEVLRKGQTKVVTGGNDAEAGPAVIAPITLRGEVLGTLRLQDIDPDRKWSNDEIALVEAISEQLGLTLENLRLFDNTQQRATREQLARKITDKMRASPDVETIIQTGINELAQALGVSRTYVKLLPASERSAGVDDIREQLKQGVKQNWSTTQNSEANGNTTTLASGQMEEN